MEEKLREALAAYSIEGAECSLIRHNENATYHVSAARDEYVLRLHIPTEGFDLALFGARRHSKSKIEGEVGFLNALADGGFLVQRPVPSKTGDLVADIGGGDCATLLEWLPGKTIEDIDEDISRRVGVLVARMHDFSRNHLELMKLDRYSYDGEMIAGMKTQLAAGNEAGAFGDLYDGILTALNAIDLRIEQLKASDGEFGLIHADLSKGNFIVNGTDVSPIDFCLSGKGCYRHDIGQLCSDFDKHRSAVFEGYSSVSGVPVVNEDADLFLAYGVLLFMSAQWSRYMNEDWFKNALQRWCGGLFRKAAEYMGFCRQA